MLHYYCSCVGKNRVKNELLSRKAKKNTMFSIQTYIYIYIYLTNGDKENYHQPYLTTHLRLLLLVRRKFARTSSLRYFSVIFFSFVFPLPSCHVYHHPHHPSSPRGSIVTETPNLFLGLMLCRPFYFFTYIFIIIYCILFEYYCLTGSSSLFL